MTRRSIASPVLIRVLIGVLALALWPTSQAQAGAWSQEQGQCYAKVWARAIVGSGAFETDGGTRGDIADYADVSAQIYAECGLHPQLTAIVFGAPFGWASAGSESAVYMGPIGVGLRFEPYWSTGATRFALQAAYSFAPPVGDDVLFEEAGADPRVFYQAALENHYGEIQALLGHGFSISRKVSAWFSGGAGVRINSAGSMSPAIVASLQLGFTFYERFQLEVHVPVYEPFARGVTETNISGVGQTRYIGWGLGASFWIADSFALTAGFEGAALASSNAATPSLIFGIESRFRVWGED